MRKNLYDNGFKPLLEYVSDDNPKRVAEWRKEVDTWHLYTSVPSHARKWEDAVILRVHNTEYRKVWLIRLLWERTVAGSNPVRYIELIFMERMG